MVLRARLIIVLTLSLAPAVWPGVAGAQVAQVGASLRGDLPLNADSAARILGHIQGAFTRVALESAWESPTAAEAALRVVEQASRGLTALRDPPELTLIFEHLEATLSAFESVQGEQDPETRSRHSNAVQKARTAAGAFPPVFYAGPNVAFAVGWQWHWDGDRAGAHSVAIATNLLGAAVGGAVTLTGAEELKGYLKENVAVGTAIPLGGTKKLSGFVQVGLGRVSLRRLTLWPVLSVEQLDTADLRLPRQLLARDPGADRWSVPGFGLGITLGSLDDLRRRVGGGKAAVVLSLGVTLPYYSSGNPFSAIADLLTGRFGGYEKVGRVSYRVGLGIPIVRVRPPKTN